MKNNIIMGIDEKLENLKIIISEVDGVITDGSFPLDELGHVLFKQFCFKDFEAINELKKHFKVVFISNNPHISYNTMRAKSIPFYFEKDKKTSLSAALRRYSFKPDEALYIGVSHSDVPCIQTIPFSVCPEDAVPEIINMVDSVLPIYGGYGVFSYVLELLRPEILRRIKLTE